jgi:hypothetical protein
LNIFFFPPFSFSKQKFIKNINAYFFGHFGKILLLLFSEKSSLKKMWITHSFFDSESIYILYAYREYFYLSFLVRLINAYQAFTPLLWFLLIISEFITLRLCFNYDVWNRL